MRSLVLLLACTAGVYAATKEVVVGPAGNYTFSPANLTLEVGDRVSFVWGSAPHTVVQGSQCKEATDSEFNLSSNSQIKFDTVGVYSYFSGSNNDCTQGMTGLITVVAKGALPAANTTIANTTTTANTTSVYKDVNHNPFSGYKDLTGNTTSTNGTNGGVLSDNGSRNLTNSTTSGNVTTTNGTLTTGGNSTTNGTLTTGGNSTTNGNSTSNGNSTGNANNGTNNGNTNRTNTAPTTTTTPSTTTAPKPTNPTSTSSPTQSTNADSSAFQLVPSHVWLLTWTAFCLTVTQMVVL